MIGKHVFKFKTILWKIYDKITIPYKFKKAGTVTEKQFLFKSNYGFKIYLDIEKDVDKFIYCGFFEREIISYFINIIKPNMVIFDIGSNIGFYSLVATTKLGNTGKVYAFEPASLPYKQFEKSIDVNKISNIKLLPYGVSDINGKMSFNICDDDAYNSLGSAPMKDVIEVVEIDVTTIDAFCETENISKIDILKMDAEGAEYMILKGGQNLFKSDNAPIIFCEFNILANKGFDYTLEDYTSILSNYGYSLYELKNGSLKKFDSKVSEKSDIICLKPYHKAQLN